MGRFFGILILTSLLISINGQALFDETEDRQRSADLALHIIRTELQQFSQSVEKIVTKQLEKVEHIEEKIDNILARQKQRKSFYYSDRATTPEAGNGVSFDQS